MARGPSGPVRDLLAARHARGGDQRRRGLLPDRREQAHPADAHAQFVVLGLEAERAGHAAAAGVELFDLGAGDALQQRDRGRGARERLLVAVPVKEDPARAHRRSRSAPSSIASTSSSSTSRVRSAMPWSPISARCSSRSVSRQDGSTPVIVAVPSRRSDSASAFAVASSSRPLEMLARPQQPALSSRTS